MVQDSAICGERLVEFQCQGLLFDMDGTLLDSSTAMKRIWGDWARRFGFEPTSFIAKIHGVRGEDTIRALNLPGVDPVAEALEIERREIEDVEGVVAISGAAEFLAQLPEERWALVTSAPIRLARARLRAAGLPTPKYIVSGDDVKIGKPDPTCFLVGAAKLNLNANQCVAFEDAAAGIASAATAGARVVVVTATHEKHHGTPHHAIAHFDGAKVHSTASGLTISL